MRPRPFPFLSFPFSILSVPVLFQASHLPQPMIIINSVCCLSHFALTCLSLCLSVWGCGWECVCLYIQCWLGWIKSSLHSFYSFVVSFSGRSPLRSLLLSRSCPASWSKPTTKIQIRTTLMTSRVEPSRAEPSRGSHQDQMFPPVWQLLNIAGANTK